MTNTDNSNRDLVAEIAELSIDDQVKIAALVDRLTAVSEPDPPPNAAIVAARFDELDDEAKRRVAEKIDREAKRAQRRGPG